MQRVDSKLICAAALVALAPIVGACSSDSGWSEIKLIPRTTDIFRGNALSYSGRHENFTAQPAGPNDLVSPDGQCPAAAPIGNPNDPGAASPGVVQGGIALQMTECEVVQRVGMPDRVDVGADERGYREVVITYTRGPRPGIYRFTQGRLASVERGPEAPAPAKQKAAPKKRA